MFAIIIVKNVAKGRVKSLLEEGYSGGDAAPASHLIEK